MAAVGRAAFTRFVIKTAVIGRSWSCRVRPCSFWPGVRVQVLGGAINLGRGLTLTLMAFLGYEAYRNIPGSLIVHANQK
ncbi:hypothetical protein scyTo_0020559, partial [Scyliorhinus torazame]|nr:hypothetical protein [Scyliorhinus torazame]